MAKTCTTIIYPVRDLDKAKALFGALLGVEPYADAPYYVGYRVDDQEIGLDPHGHNNGMTGPVPYWNVDDIEATITSLEAAGAEVRQPATDVGGGMQIAILADADGNPIGLRQEA